MFLPYSTSRVLTASSLRPMSTEVDSRRKTSSRGMRCHSRPDNSCSACALSLASDPYDDVIWDDMPAIATSLGFFASVRLFSLSLGSSMSKALDVGQTTSETMGSECLHCLILDRKKYARVNGASHRMFTVYR